MTKIRLLAALLLLFAACNSHPEETDCARFKVGEFHISLKKTGQEFKIVRNDVNQIETNLTTGTVGTFKIEWKSACEYELTLLSRKPGPTDSLTYPPAGSKLDIQIISTGTNYYVFEGRVPGRHFAYRDTLWLTKSR
jgi:hypothetical protein